MKIFIFGGPGSGKTTVAKKLSEEFKIPHFELDKIFYEKGATYEQNREDERERIISDLIRQKDWIIEGLYRQEWLNKVLKEADVVFILQIPKLIRNIRTTTRTTKQLLGIHKSRPANLKLFFDFFRTNNEYDKKRLSQFQERLISVGQKPVFVSSYEDMAKYLCQNFGEVI